MILGNISSQNSPFDQASSDVLVLMIAGLVGYDQGRALPDLKEMFGIGTYNPLAEMPEQRWPEKPAEFHPALHEYFMAMVCSN